LRVALRAIWDRLGTVLTISLTGTAVLLVSLASGLLLPHALPAPLRTLLVTCVTAAALSPLLAVGFDIALHILTHRDISGFPLLLQGRKYGAVAIRLGLIHLAAAALAGLNVTFYLQLHGLVGRIVVLLCLYLALMWSAMALYQGPLLVLQETGAFDESDRIARRGAKAVIRRSFYLVIGEPLFTAGLLLVVLLWTAATMLTAVGAAMLWLGGICLLTTAPALALLAKYGVIHPTASADSPPKEEA
jgi:hypothetical protein